MRYVPSIVVLLAAGCVISRPIEVPDDAAEPAAAAEAVAASEEVPAPEEGSQPPGEEIGESIQGRSIRMTSLGHGPRRVIWLGGIHGDEQEGRLAAQRLPADFLAHTGAADAVTLYLVHNLNPDGEAMRQRGNANGVDLNRNFPAKNFSSESRFGGEPLSQPESKALGELIERIEPHLVISSHAWRGDHFINYDGPAQQLAILFSTLSGYRVRVSEDISPTPGSLGSWVGVDLQTPILTVEYERGKDPEDAWRETRVALLAVILGE